MASLGKSEPVFSQLAQLPPLPDQANFPRAKRPARSAPQRSGLTASLHGANTSSSSDMELLELIMKQPSDAAAPATTFLGVSPPVRSGCCGGAANPWSHDRSWKQSAYSASCTNLAALRELDSEGESFLRRDHGAGALVLGSTPVGLGGLGGGVLPAAAPMPPAAVVGFGAAGSGSGPAHAHPMAVDAASDAGSDATTLNTTAPFQCHTAYFLG